MSVARSGRLVLVVDDTPVNLKLVCELLQSEGWIVDGAADAQEALAALERGLPDLVLMDLALPGMDGLTLTRRLKADTRYAHIPIVALTAFAMKGDEAKARAAGCDGYITKPIDTRRFAQQVASFLRAGAGGAAAGTGTAGRGGEGVSRSREDR